METPKLLISVQNFRSIRNIQNWEVAQTTILIGQNASGKSTLAKLVYLSRILLNNIVDVSFFKIADIFEISKNLNIDDLTLAFDLHLQRLCIFYFKEYFGFIDDDFEIKFTFGKFYTISFSNIEGNIQVKISANLLKDSLLSWADILEKETAKDIIELKASSKKRKFYHDLCSKDLNIPLVRGIYYIPTSRAAKLLINKAFAMQTHFLEKIDVQKLNADPDFFKKIDKKLVVDLLTEFFILHIRDIRDEILFNKGYNQLIAEYRLNNFESLTLQDEQKQLRAFLNKMTTILKGEFSTGNLSEGFVIEGNKHIPFAQASSGQQEIVWVLWILFSKIYRKADSHVIIEEPEANLYPTAQKELMDAAAMFINYNPDNQLLMTTHSPYLLTSLNNLLFAYQVWQKHPDKKEEIIKATGTDAWLNPSNFAAYYMRDGELENIVDADAGLIYESKLDDVSDELKDIFDNLLDIYRKAKNELAKS